ncbi:hypothetical protein BKA69DRAFT_703671 [Paraphysoderma sedebokerense]|nr:hypothetical protein BKA69DRAFT_703671 [Paraphysoderma sedebokerense]
METILKSALTSRYLLYVPDNEFTGIDNLIFRACDQYTCAPTDGMITFNVTSVNDPPIAYNQTITMYEDTSVGITLNFSDIDSNVENSSITLKTLPPGKISTNDTTEIKTVPYRLASSYLVYTSPQNAAGPPPNFVFANFTFVVSDGISSSTIGVIYLQILPVDDIPLSKDLAVSIDENTDALIQLVCTDIDTVPSALYIMITRLPENGTLYQHTDAGRGPPILGRVDDGQLWFAPSRNYIGQSSFSYECRDIFGVTSRSARVNISVNPGLACVKQLDLSFDFLLGNSDVFSITLMRDIAVEGFNAVSHSKLWKILHADDL